MLELVRRGDISKCSFKFTVEEDEWRYADKDNGLEYDERTIRKIDKLYDVSLVVYPAYNDTEAGVRHLEERKQQFFNTQHHEDNSQQTQTSMAMDGAKDSAADSQVPRKSTHEVHSLARARLTSILKLKH